MAKRVRAPNKARTEIYLDPSEKQRLQGIAKDLNLSLSELCRRLLLDKPLPNTEKMHGLKVLFQVNGDLARLGNLYREAERRTSYITNEELEAAFQRVQELKALLLNKIRQIGYK